MSIKIQYNLKVKFQQKSFGNLNFNRLFKDIHDLFPVQDCLISVAYSYCKSLSKKIFNYRQRVFLDSDNFLNCCNWDEFVDFINFFHGHVITGDLNTIINKNVKY